MARDEHGWPYNGVYADKWDDNRRKKALLYAAQREEKIEKLEKALTDLNPFQKKCIEMFYLKNMTYNQIVELTGFSANEVKSHIQNGKRNLKMLLTNSK